jgi:3-isopropylmalate/(R)-2-methylmalate dehydratase large subunit
LAFTLYDKIWNEHVVHEEPDGACLLYVDRHIVHEVDSPQAFAGLRRSGLPVKAPQKTFWSSTTMCRHRTAAGRTRIP